VNNAVGREIMRLVGITFLTVFAILLANPHTKAEYKHFE